MTITLESGITVLRPADGKYLTNGAVYSELVYLGINDSAENWSEVDEIPPDDVANPDDDATEQDYKDALAEFGVTE